MIKKSAFKNNIFIFFFFFAIKNPELEAQIQALKARFANEEYMRMVKNVDLNSPLRFKETFSNKTLSTDCTFFFFFKFY